MPSVTPVAAARVQSAIALAASRTGIDFGYLLGQAKLESGLNASARAGTSSASGLYQFIEQSWLAVVKQHGAEHGLGWAASNIQQLPNGRYTVGDASTRQAILDLRNDPTVASLMAAEHAGDNKASLEASLGRAATGADLYMAHFLGRAGATKFLKTMAADPRASGVEMFPAAAAANRGVFYDAGGQPRSLAAIYQRFTDKLGAAGSGSTGGASFETQALDLNGATVITGNNQSAGDALAWAQTAIGSAMGNRATSAANLVQAAYRPTPDTARLAYLMLAGLGA